MKLKVTNGKVNYIMKSGKDTVKGQMAEATAKSLCKDPLKSNERPGYEIKAGDYIFEGTFFEEEKKGFKR